MRTTSRRPITTALMLVGAMVLLAGCGDEGAHLPAGMTGSSAAAAGGTTGIDLVDDVIDGDPGPSTAGVSTMVDDPVLAGYDGIDTVGSLTDDPYSRAVSDWNDTEGSLGGIDSGYDFDEPMPVGYGGYGDGYGDDFGFSSAYGYGGSVLAAAGMGGFHDAGIMDAGMMDPGFVDPGFEDPGFVDPGFSDPGFVDVGFDAGIDPGFVDAGFDPGFADVGAVDVGMVDVGAVDMGGFDTGIAVF